MPGEPTAGEAEALKTLREAAMATKKQAEDAAAALLAADPRSGPLLLLGTRPPPPWPVSTSRRSRTSCPGLSRSPPRGCPTVSRLSHVRTLRPRHREPDLSRNAAAPTTSVSLRGRLFRSRNSLIPRRACLPRSSVSKAWPSVSPRLALGVVLDKPVSSASPASPAPPPQAVCKIADYKDGALLHERLEELITSSKAKLKELTIVWSAPSYRH